MSAGAVERSTTKPINLKSGYSKTQQKELDALLALWQSLFNTPFDHCLQTFFNFAILRK